jgi:hypothetical protein
MREIVVSLVAAVRRKFMHGRHADKGKRGRKRKGATSEVDEASIGKANRGRKRKSASPEADASEPKGNEARTSNTPESARDSTAQMTAPVARMW